MVCGICGVCLGIKGLLENICVKLIVGWFFEYSRIMCYGNGFGLLFCDVKVYIFFVDWMS